MDYQEKKAKKQAKKQKEITNIRIPSGSKMARHEREKNRAEGRHQAVVSIITFLIVGAILIFILSGGINQKLAVEWFVQLCKNIVNTINNWIHPDEMFQITENGIYFK